MFQTPEAVSVLFLALYGLLSVIVIIQHVVDYTDDGDDDMVYLAFAAQIVFAFAASGIIVGRMIYLSFNLIPVIISAIIWLIAVLGVLLINVFSYKKIGALTRMKAVWINVGMVFLSFVQAIVYYYSAFHLPS